jgi:hypothetical protein
MHDLEIITVLDANLAERRPGHNFKIPFHRDAQRIESKLVQHLRDADGALQPLVLAVDADTDTSVQAHRGTQ